LVNIDQTTSDEQRKTDWIDTESLENFLDPNDPSKTIEGYPAPLRAIFIANN
jgi:tRNA (mo5U34)-methyltransferase